MACDLHTHSTFSDGSDTPEELVEKAVELGLTALVLSDHNVADGLPSFLKAAAGKPIRAVPGVEFSTDYRGEELHLLGLFIPPEEFAGVRALTEAPLRAKEESNRRLVAKLTEAGYELDYEEIRRATPEGVVNRSHISRALKAKGYFPEEADLFRTLLSEDGDFYTPPERLKTLDVIRYLRKIRAVAVLAHPLLSLDEQTLRTFLQEAVPVGLDGMETVYVTYDEKTAALAAAMAAEYGILPSGGSDYHGSAKAGIHLGRGRGNLLVPDEFYVNLAALAAKRQRGEEEA